MDFKFKKMQNGNVQELVYKVLNDYFMKTGLVMDRKKAFVAVQDARNQALLPYIIKSTLNRSIRRMRKVIEFKRVQLEIDKTMLEIMNEGNKLLNEKKLIEQFLSKAVWICLISILIVIWVILFDIIVNWNV